MNALLVYPRFPDTYWSFRYALSFQGKRAAQSPLGLVTFATLRPASWNKCLIDIRSIAPASIFGTVRALFLSVLCQGIRGRTRLSYSKFMFFVATHHRRSFGAAMIMVVMGYHFQIMTQRLYGAGV